jgi:poly-gamma-glutamate synthase PgsB/CapB
VVLVLFYALESLRLERNRRRLSLRICVTGARGKSSVVRLLAAALRAAGFQVLAKTTGTRPMLLLPDGSEVELRRRGRPSVLEQIRIIRKAAELSADVVVAELMSFRPETLSIESLSIFKPNLLLITNARPDHTEHWGASRETAARCLASAIGPECTVFIPEEEYLPVWEAAAARTGGAAIRFVEEGYGQAAEGLSSGTDPEAGPETQMRFVSNERLVRAVTDSLNIDGELADLGIRGSLPDLGRLSVWSWRPGPGDEAWDCVSAFAANDPASTRRVFDKIAALGLLDGKPVLGLLNLRRDRGDRTLQWLDALRAGSFPEFRALYITGSHAHAFKRRLRGKQNLHPVVIRNSRPEAVMSFITARSPAPGLIFGMGNMGGPGRELLEYWEGEGEPHVV